MKSKNSAPLRRGWTTGACATAATKAALTGLVTGRFPDPVEIVLPKGETVSFVLTEEALLGDFAEAAIVKDAGDDPDVTHGATIRARVRLLPPQSGLRFCAGNGVGTITLPGLPLPPGEPAINPVPRAMMNAVVTSLADFHQIPADVEVTISIDNGEELARKTMNPRLGIVGGLSVLGTTGIVRPFSCAAWIASIHRGIDVARATGQAHVIAPTGATSETAARKRYDLPDEAILDMGDFAGGVLKYLREHPVERLTISGGLGKLTKLAQGALDLHSARSQVDFDFLTRMLEEQGASPAALDKCRQSNTAKQAIDEARGAGYDLPTAIVKKAKEQATSVLRHRNIKVEVLAVDRQGEIVGECGFDE